MGAVVVAVPWRDAEPTWCSAQKNTHLEISDLFCAQRYAAVSLLLFKTAKHTWTIHSIILKEVTKRPWETFFQSSIRYAPAAHQQRVVSSSEPTWTFCQQTYTWCNLQLTTCTMEAEPGLCRALKMAPYLQPSCLWGYTTSGCGPRLPLGTSLGTEREIRAVNTTLLPLPCFTVKYLWFLYLV